MKIQEAADRLKMTKRAIKYYEEKGLLKPKRSVNGYREYDEEDIECLAQIVFLRRLGLSLDEIKMFLDGNDRVLEDVLARQEQAMQEESRCMEALCRFMQTKNRKEGEQLLSASSMLEAIETLLPGEWGKYLSSHFAPFLKEPLHTEEQKQAMERILRYCDDHPLKLPWFYRFFISPVQESRTAEEMIAQWEMDEETYQKRKVDWEKAIRFKMGIWRFHPVYIMQRRMQRQMQDSGYNAIVIENMKIVSPSYARYKKNLDAVNERFMREMGVYYDHHFNLKKQKASR